jgi:hypothetical protein
MARNDDYKIGYGRPPLHTQFPKGKSGNPTGKRAQRPTTVELIERELRKTVVVTENGKQKRITKHEAMMMRCVQQALQGDLRARKLILDTLSAAKADFPMDDFPIEFTLKLEEDPE